MIGFADMVVTPFVGVWIEIISAIPASMSCGVTPFVGVWIEIGIPHDIAVLIMSLPSWECGLKCQSADLFEFLIRHSLRGSVD